ncbi:hypothetical protein CTI12_AA560210 [Artemisia annua]|uniref:Ubiquitin-like protease family profile domain-containing protein n=1 Tax=Artemisia annua TaxID=35608 RepID=A0A2U1KVF9_ARTAN|nr:hypothetical protein CTI12_AA560210 [Artemisia annua]
MEIEEDADDKKKKKKYIIKEEPPASPQIVKGRYKKSKSSPKAMSDAMVGLTEMRKKCLKDIGFERFINFPITELPGALLYYVVDKFHPTSMELRLEKGSIKITKQRIHDMIGAPMGKTKLEDLEQRGPDDPFIAEWESHTMGKVDNGAKVYRTVLQHVKENDVISDIDWCGYILECLRKSRQNWEKVKKGDFYYGPATFLCLLYLDSTNFTNFKVMRHRPAMRSWNTQAMRKRIGMEIKDNCLGKLEHHEEFDPKEEQTGLNFFKGTDVYNEPLPPKRPETKEEFVDKIEEKFENISNEKAELAETLKEGMQKFKGDKTLFTLCKNGDKEHKDGKDDKEETESENESEKLGTEKEIPAENEKEKQIAVENEKEKQLEKEKETPVENEKEKETSTIFSYEPIDEHILDEIFKQADRVTQTKERKTKNTARKSVTPPEKMIATRSKMKSISPPSFSLGISPPSIKPAAQTDTTTVEVTPQVEKRAAVETDATTSEPKPKTEKTARKIVAEKENKEEEPPAKRTKKPSRYLVSPYNNRKTVLKAPQTPDESMVTEALFSMQGDPYEFVFQTEWARGAATIRDNMQTLAPQLNVDTKQIVEAKKEEEAKQYKDFCENITTVFAKNPDDKTMHQVELAFFPIIAHEHFYLVVFNISKGTSVIIDNSPKAYDAKYKKECDVLSYAPKASSVAKPQKTPSAWEVGVGCS